MLKNMGKYFLFFIIFLIKITFVNAEIVKSISVNGNDRISDKTVIIFSKVNIGDELIINDLNEIIVNLYNTDFFENISVNLKDNVLSINVKENDLIQSVEINGVKNKKLKQALFDQLLLNENKSYAKEKSNDEILKLSNFLKLSGYYFSKVDLKIKKNDNNTVNLIYNIDINKKSFIKKINFTCNIIFKSRLLSIVIYSE
jgi:outer membrane protein insertion porin family